MSATRTTRALTLGLLAALAAACSEAPNAPLAGAADGLSFDKGGIPRRADDVVATTILIDPTVSQVYKLGADHFVYVPARAVCAPDTPYGMGEWDKPCARADRPVGVDVVISTRDGVPTATFYPDLRFAPAAEGDHANWVFLGLKVRGGAAKKAADRYAILYRPTGTLDLIDESITDPTLRAFRYKGMIVRRLKHFSGYNVSLGVFTEQPADVFTGVLGGLQ